MLAKQINGQLRISGLAWVPVLGLQLSSWEKCFRPTFLPLGILIHKIGVMIPASLCNSDLQSQLKEAEAREPLRIQPVWGYR